MYPLRSPDGRQTGRAAGRLVRTRAREKGHGGRGWMDRLSGVGQAGGWRKLGMPVHSNLAGWAVTNAQRQWSVPVGYQAR